MSKVLRCYDVGTECGFTIRAETEDEILVQAQEHARTNHGMNQFGPEMIAKLKAFITDE